MKVYVAGASAERGIIARYIFLLQERGIEITHDWTSCEGYNRPTTVSERLTYARQDLDGVRRADLVWNISYHGSSHGSATELGAALALGKTVFISGPGALRESRIFNLLATRYFPTHDEALIEICALAKEK